MRLLILGGTKFLGRHIAIEALDRGHHVTVFHRGQHDPEALPEAEHRIGDRMSDLSALETGQWDAVIDTSGQHPRAVRDAATLLGERVEHYCFVSSISAYAEPLQPHTREDAALAEPAGLDAPESLELYAALKSGCEQQLRSLRPAPLVVRPGLIVGPHDPTPRFNWWVLRLARGGKVIVPRCPTMQWLDVRDLASWLVDCAESRTRGTFNAVGPGHHFEALLKTALTPMEPRWFDEDELLAKVEPWTEIPLWTGPEEQAFSQVDGRAAREAGLRHRPLAQTVTDTWAWLQHQDHSALADAYALSKLLSRTP